MDSLCRTCTISSDATPTVYQIYKTTNLADKIKRCTALAIDALDGYPTWICNKCFQQIERIWKFQEKCRKSIHKFNEMLEVNPTPVTAAVPANSSRDTIASNVLKDSRLYISEITVNRNIEVDPLIGLKNKTSCCKQEATQQFESITSQIVEETDISYDNMIAGDRKSCQTPVKYFNDRKGKCKAMASDNTVSSVELEQDSDENIDLLLLPFKCNICPKRFAVHHCLVAHQRMHKGLLCALKGCDVSFNCEHAEPSQVFKCDINNCNREYKKKSSLNVHKRKYHHCGPELKSHMCEICGKVFKSSAVLKYHHFTHVEKSQLPYECDEEGCTKRFTKKEKLETHKMRHAGIKNFICPHCGMRKTTRNELKIHINYHTLERTWPCRFCDKVFNNSGNLKMHVRNIHELAKDFACSYCDRTFAKANTKKYHEMTHTGEKPHVCDECGRRFLQPAALRTHRKVHIKKVMAAKKVMLKGRENVSSK